MSEIAAAFTADRTVSPHRNETTTTPGSASNPEVGDAVETFSFELDDDLVKIVTVALDDRSCHVNVRYGRDVLLQEENHAFAVDAPIEVVRHSRGISIRSTQRFLGLFHRKRIRRF